MHDWLFTGRIDAVTDREGVSTIVDFKTATKPWASGAEHSKEQAAAYLLADSVLGIFKASRVTFITFTTTATENGFVCRVEMRPTNRTHEQIRRYTMHALQTAMDIEDALDSGDFPVRTSPLCAWCGCLASCTEGQVYLRESGRPIAVPLAGTLRP
jgi:hypothetical protein